MPDVRIYRHVIIAIARRYSKNDWSNDNEGEDDNNLFGDDLDGIDMCNDILDLQAGHTTNTANPLYVHGSNNNQESNQSLINSYLQISILHHDFI